MMNDTCLGGRRSFFIDDVKRILDSNFLVGVNALEIHVQDNRFVCMNLKVAQQNLFFLAVDFQIENGGLE